MMVPVPPVTPIGPRPASDGVPALPGEPEEPLLPVVPALPPVFGGGAVLQPIAASTAALARAPPNANLVEPRRLPFIVDAVIRR
jgi:hypothetical protein